MSFTPGSLDLPRCCYVWFSKPHSNPWLTRQPHGLCAFSLFLFLFFKIFPWNVPSLASPGVIPSCLGHVSSWPGGAGLLTENAALCCGLVWMLWSSLAQSNLLGDVGRDLLCRGRGAAKDSFLLFWPWKQSALPAAGTRAGVFSKCHWCFCKVAAWESGWSSNRAPWCSFAWVCEYSLSAEMTSSGERFCG